MPSIEASRGRNTEKLLLSDSSFLIQAQRKFNINSIYYPGAWDDQSLHIQECGWRVVTLDNDHETFYGFDGCDEFDTSAKQISVFGDMSNAPFKKNTFDAVFIQDIHANEKEYSDILRVVKPFGLVIFSTNDCGMKNGIHLVDIEQDRRLYPASFPYVSEHYSLFRKRPTHNDYIRKYLK